MKQFVIALFVFLLNSCNSTEPDDSSLNNMNRILFTMRESYEGNSQIYSINPDGTDLRRITNDEFSYSQVCWSPNRTQVAGTTDENWTTAGLHMFVMDSDGTNKKLLSIGSQITWLPNGKELLYSNMPSSGIGLLKLNIYKYDIENETFELIIENGGSPDINKNGDKLVYGAIDYSVEPVGKPTIILTFPSFEKILTIQSNKMTYPTWSPDGKILVYTKDDEIYTMAMIDTIESKVFDNTSSLHYIYPKFSPDGQKIIFTGYTDGLQESFLFMVNIDGTELHKVYESDGIISCDW